MIIDAHLHCTGRETTDGVLRALDHAGIDKAVLLAPFLDNGYSLDDPPSLQRGNEHLARLIRGHTDRLIGFAVVDPRDRGAPDELSRAIETLGLHGAKMVPTGWRASDERVQPVFARAAALSLPLLFHSGIFIDGRSGRFCRPCEFEVLRNHPGVRVALAHLGWPWTDEAIAVGLIDRIHGVPPADAVFRFDISFGPPPPYRLEVLRRALEVLGPESLQFGSDCFLPCSGEEIAGRRGWVVELMDQLELDEPTRQQVFGGTAAAWLRQPASPSADGAAIEVHASTSTSRSPSSSRSALSTSADRDARSPVGQSSATARPRRGWLSAPGRIGRFCC
ncbi:MAG TPA: amidohydrolase family protein [Burkholderiaceae bacterium]|nr:amidohydrolase family protein [Burkholderiaceae bacterium]